MVGAVSEGGVPVWKNQTRIDFLVKWSEVYSAPGSLGFVCAVVASAKFLHYGSSQWARAVVVA